MDFQLTGDQILAMAPDASAAALGRKLGNARQWRLLGMSAEALWGECQGSGKDPYQVKIELASLSNQCSCPSRKLPCKHCLGLLLLAADGSIPEAEPPEWVSSWLDKRQASSARKEKRAAQASGDATPVARPETAEKRLANVSKGLDTLDLWLNDLMRQGLANVQTQPAAFWEKAAARLRDAQAGALDTRLRALAAIPNASPDWPEKLLGELGKLALLTHAFRREEQLEAGLREDIRQLIGWSLSQEEVRARGGTLRDDWLILGQTLEEDYRGKAQRTWLYGTRSERAAMILQFSMAGRPFAERFIAGTHMEAELSFWPGAYPQRALLTRRLSGSAPLSDRLPGTAKIDAFLSGVAQTLARNPWLDRFLCLLRAVTPLCSEEGREWYIRDSDGKALPLDGDDGWLLLALSGGHRVDLAAEWNGERLRPLGVMADGAYMLPGGMH